MPSSRRQRLVMDAMYKRPLTVDDKKLQGMVKKRTTKYGRKIARVLVDSGSHLEEFTIHEDLLCLDSPYFRKHCQAKRKPLDDKEDQDCSVCKEPLDRSDHDLTYCSAECGRTFHHGCIQKWLKGKAEPQKTCPMCRKQWVNEDNNIQQYKFPEMRNNDYSTYHEWLYRGNICMDKDQGVSIWNAWVSAYTFGAKIEDNNFCTALLKYGLEYMQETKTYPRINDVYEAYSGSKPGSPIRHYLVFVFARNSDWQEALSTPTDFLMDVIREMRKINETDQRDSVQWNAESTMGLLCADADHAPYHCSRWFERPEAGGGLFGGLGRPESGGSMFGDFGR